MKSKYESELKVGNKTYKIWDIQKLAESYGFDINSLPYSLRVLLENALRNGPEDAVFKSFAKYGKQDFVTNEVNFKPARVLMQDFTGVPAVVDLAAMRDAMKKLGGDPEVVNPLIPVDLVIDHSVQVDFSGDKDSFEKNTKLEFIRNNERYEFLKWGQSSFRNFRVVPPGTGICHQVNLEYIAQVVWVSEDKDGSLLAYPDTLVGTDSHTTMVNGLGVLGWGVGGIEAEAAMLGQSLPMLIPDVVGVELLGSLSEGITATDLVLTITEALRKLGVVGKFVEYFGNGLRSLTLADRATIANMAPEYGATCGFFPTDEQTIEYLRLTGRDEERIALVEAYNKKQALWAGNDSKINYTTKITLNLNEIKPSLAGPKRPQDRVLIENVSHSINKEIELYEIDAEKREQRYSYSGGEIGHGDVAIAAITSCTNTSNPYVLIAAGLLAKKAVELGATKKPWVKSSLAPGSQVVTEYLNVTGLSQYLDELGFNLVGYGCTTCIGNSGPLDEKIEEIINKNKLLVASVLSGNRNFEGRVHPLVRANYLASPPLVVAYALAGTMKIDLNKDPLYVTKDGKNIYLKDIWPSNKEIMDVLKSAVDQKMFTSKYSNVYKGDAHWQEIHIKPETNYNWDPKSTYINNPPYFENFSQKTEPLKNIDNARILAIFGDSITTDHISPAGNISKISPAAKYLNERGIEQKDFNSYGARRGNHEVMMRGTFANIRIKNKMLKEVEGGYTIFYPTREQLSIYDASMQYQKAKTPLVIFAGKEYGTGSSRDWAAKGTSLLGVKAVIAESFERIHRSNLVGMGVLPLQLIGGYSVEKLGLSGEEEVCIMGVDDHLKPSQNLLCQIKRDGIILSSFEVQAMVMTENEVEYIKHGSILHQVVKQLHKQFS